LQLTMYKKCDMDMMITSADGVQRIYDICEKFEGSNVKIIYADNLQRMHTCTAGINSCGITYDGYAVYCLSERSWMDSIRIQGPASLLTYKLKNIWENEFKHNRFHDRFDCCRDCISYPLESHHDSTSESMSISTKGMNYKDGIMLYGVYEEPYIIRPNPKNYPNISIYSVGYYNTTIGEFMQ